MPRETDPKPPPKAPTHREGIDSETSAPSNLLILPVMGRPPPGKLCGSVTTADMIARGHCCYWQRAARGDDGPALGEGHFGSCGNPAYENPTKWVLGPTIGQPRGSGNPSTYRIPPPFPSVRSGFGCALWTQRWPEPDADR